MKKLAIAILMLSACSHQPINTADYLSDSRATAKSFMEKLGTTLKQQIQSDGVNSAIPVCKQVAPAIAAEYSINGKLVKRVSTKARNTTQGIPDEWELAALNQFSTALKTSPEIKEVEMSEVVNEADGRFYRYAKAIRVQQMCLNCHGQAGDISPDVSKTLAEHYPNDVATGYQLGDIRGAVSIKYELD